MIDQNNCNFIFHVEVAGETVSQQCVCAIPVGNQFYCDYHKHLINDFFEKQKRENDFKLWLE